MPAHKSCKKRIKTAAKSNLRNRVMKSRISTAIKKVETAKSKDEAVVAVKSAYSVIDKAVKANVLHKNNAANKKSLVTRISSAVKG